MPTRPVKYTKENARNDYSLLAFLCYAVVVIYLIDYGSVTEILKVITKTLAA